MLTLQNKTIICLTLFFCFFLSPLAFGQGKTEWLNDKVTLRFQEEPMSSVLGKLSQQTGIAILYDEKLAGQKVTGLYKDIKFAEAINRLFSETNKSIQVLKNEKKIIVKTFGAKNFVLALSAQQVPSSVDKVPDNSEKMTLAEVEAMHKRQYKEYKMRLADENEVLEGGLTRAQAKERILRDNAQFKQKLKNEDEILEGWKTRAEVRKMIQQEHEKFQKSLSDDSEVIPEGGGMNRGQLRELIKKDRRAYEESLSRNDTIIEGGLTKQAARRAIEENKEFK
ncbi:MAG: hypothetical protein D3905_04365 [Candidatus Electrothrix sp. AS4_5]|nr:hypothetical protein [Candidatus Electrothrix gigas]